MTGATVKTIRKFEIRIKRQKLPKLSDQKVPYSKCIMGPDDAIEIARGILDGEIQEVFLVLLMNPKNRVMGYMEVHRGGIDICQVDPRMVYLPAVQIGCSSIIVVHNHPSRDPSPSPDDMALTKRLMQCGQILGIALLDHIIVGGEENTSMGRDGLFNFSEGED